MTTNNLSSKKYPKTIFELTEEISDISPLEDNFKVQLKNGLSTIISKKDGNLINPDLWFHNYENFSSDFYIVQNENALKTLITKIHGSFVYPDIWFNDWHDFNDDFYKVTDKNGLRTLLRKDDGSFVYPNTWFNDWYDFNDDFYKVTNQNGLKTLISKKDASFPYPNVWFYDWHNYSDDMYKVENTRREYTFISKNDGSFINKNLWFIEIYTLDKFPPDTSRCSIIYTDYKYSFYGVIYRKDILLVENAQGLFSFIFKKDFSFVQKNLWFKHLERFDDKTYLVELASGYFTLINKTDLLFLNSNLFWPSRNDLKSLNDRIYILHTKAGDELVWKNNLSFVNDNICLEAPLEFFENGYILVKFDGKFHTFKSLEEYINYTLPNTN